MQPTPAPSSPPQSQSQSNFNVQDHESYPTAPINTGTAPFYVLTTLFEMLQVERKHDRRRRLLENWFKEWRKNAGNDLYPVLRLLLPQKDRERAIYNLKETSVAKIYMNIIGLNKTDADYIRLVSWKKPHEIHKSSGDFTTVLYEVIDSRSSVTEGWLTIEEVNEVLDGIAKNGKNIDAQTRIMKKVYNTTTATEQRWLVRIILKDMAISVKENTVLSVFHPDAQDLFNACSDLKRVAWELWNRSHRLDSADTTVKLFSAFAPMLCKRPTRRIEDSIKGMGDHKFIIEEKLDGERMQLHKRGSEYFYCSRKGKNYTSMYGQHCGEGQLTPFIDEAFDPRVESVILDGEMLVWDPISEQNLPFGNLKTAALDKSKNRMKPRPCFKVFDILYLNGHPLLQKPLKWRKTQLKAIIAPTKGHIEFAVEYEGSAAKDIRQRLNQIMAERGEGLVIKHPLSEYVLNGRNKDWTKIKPEYMDNMGETMDLLVVGGNYGSAKRGTGVSTLICAVAEDRDVEVDTSVNVVYNTFARVGTGLSYSDYMWVREKPWKPWDRNDPPPFLRTARGSADDKGDMYLEPEDSFIIKVKASEITATNQYGMGYTMRFPRAMSIRDDLSVSDCMTASAVFESIRSLKKRKMESDVVHTKKRRKVQAKKPLLDSRFDLRKNMKDPVETDLFDDLSFSIFKSQGKNGEEEKNELSRLIHINGGKITVLPQPGSFIIYGGTKKHVAIKPYIDQGFDILNPMWIHDSIKQGDLMPFRKRYFFYAPPERQIAEEYEVEDEEDWEQVDGPQQESIDDHNSPSPTPSPLLEASEISIDPSVAEWFKIPENKRNPITEEDSVTEDESDPDSFDEADRQGPPESDFEEIGEAEIKETKEKVPEVQMGEDDDVMEYDTDKIFRHLCFYIDTPTSARSMGLLVDKSSAQQADMEKKLTEISALIESNGGRITSSLKEPKLTHVIFDRRDVSRALDIGDKTSIPKRRHLIITDWVEACLDEQSLIDEDDFKA